MRGLVQDIPLATSATIAHAAACHGHVEVVTAERGVAVHRYGYAEAEARMRRLASALPGLGIGPGDVAGALAWNTHRLFELMHAVPGSGAVLHTANPRLHPDHVAYAIDHAGDRVVFVDPDCLPLAEAVAARCPRVERWVILAGRDGMLGTALAPALCYEEIVASGAAGWAWPELDERSGSTLCYTSGTTGLPKGVLYSHRGTVLNVMAAAGADCWGLGHADAVLALAPFFHCNGWGLPYMAPMTGAKLVLPGRMLDTGSLLALIRGEGVSVAGGVPTIWLGLLDRIEAEGGGLGRLSRVLSGGTAPPADMIDRLDAQGVRLIHAWGMTETTHASTVAMAEPGDAPEVRRRRIAAQGRPLFGSRLRVVDDAGMPLPADGTAVGRLQARGHWVASAYFRSPDVAANTADGWLDTGDLGTLGPDMTMTILDRAKDAIKSGGEWISSVELENAALGCPGVAEAAAIGVPHPRWQERPLLLVVRAPGATVDEAAIRAHLAGRLARWCLPDAIRFVDGLPRTGTGKVLKARLRSEWAGVLAQG